jgi:hypothetical protein
LNLRPSGYEPDELPGCSTPRGLWPFCAAGFAAALGEGLRRELRDWARGRLGLGIGAPGGDLLCHALRRSTIGAEGFHGRVRDGIGCFAPRCGHQAAQAPDPGRSGVVAVLSVADVGARLYPPGAGFGAAGAGAWV